MPGPAGAIAARGSFTAVLAVAAALVDCHARAFKHAEPHRCCDGIQSGLVSPNGSLLRRSYAINSEAEGRTVTAISAPSFLSTGRGKLTLSLLAEIGFLDFTNASIVHVAVPDMAGEIAGLAQPT